MVSPRKTRLKNATQHPGLVNKPATRRTTAEVKAIAQAKQAAKVAKKEAKMASVHRAAAFESTAMAEEDFMDATPRPKFNPRSTSHATSTKMETSCDVEMSDNSSLNENTADDDSEGN